MKVLDKIVKGDIAPKQTGVLWLNTTDGKLYTFDESGKGWVPEYDADTVKEVDTLPEITEDNKTKIFKIKDEANLYAPALIKSTTAYTNRLPDEQQIDKAYLYDTNNNFVLYYKGIWKFICTDGEISLYCWGDDWDHERVYFTYDNAETINSSSEMLYIPDTVYESVDEDAKTIIDDETIEDLKSYFNVMDFMVPIPATYNAPESAQIGNAALDDEGEYLTWVYNGTSVTLTIDGEQFTGYKWLAEEYPDDYILTDKQASNIYFYNDNGTIYCDVKCYRVSNGDAVSENILYIDIPQLNAPDSEQVDNAYIYDIYGQHKYYYKGLESIVCTDGTINAPHWVMEGTDGTQQNNSLFTTPSANSLYQITTEYAFGFLNYQPNYSGQDHAIFYDTTNNVWKSTANSESTAESITNSASAESYFDDGIEISTVKYQRTETTEEWGWKQLSTPLIQSITYAELKALCDNKQLVPGQQYRITDYVTTTAQANTQSAGHQFDIIVVANSEDKLNENARAIQHSSDTYFANCKLESWELKYCLDNDTARFSWADSTNGKGVIYHMKDEWNNECPYDFKNIQFKRWEVTAYTAVPALVVDGEGNYNGFYYGTKDLGGNNVLSNATYGSNSGWFYTFALKDLASGEWYDYTVINALGLKNDEGNELVCYGNKINEAKDEYNSGKGSMPIVLNNIVIFNCYTDLSDTSYPDDYSYCQSNTFGTDCNSNTLGDYCHNNTFGDSCFYNTFGNFCENNTLGTNCARNTFGNYCSSNTFGTSCLQNIFGDNCICNTFGDSCIGNNFTTNYDTSSLRHINVLSGYSANGAVPAGIVVHANYTQIVGYNSQDVFTVKSLLD